MESDALAQQRGVDIANLARLNAHIIQRLQAGIIVTDHNHRIRLINETALKLLGLPTAGDGQLLETISPDLSRKFNDWMKAPDAEPTLLVSEAAGTTLLPQFTLLGTGGDQG
jgi:two-component system sensor histidine kinase PilS (NtrC family)